MAVPFPSGLPRPLRAGYGYSVDPISVAQKTDRGLQRSRRFGTGKSVSLNLTFNFSDSDLVTFANWWRNTIQYGTLPFSIKLVCGYDDVAMDVRPIKSYSAHELIGAWQVSFPVEIISLPIASQDVMQDAIDNYDSLILADDFHHLVHVTIPEDL